MHKFVKKALNSNNPSTIFGALKSAKTEEEFVLLCDRLCLIHGHTVLTYYYDFANKLKQLPCSEETKSQMFDKLFNGVIAAHDPQYIFYFVRDFELSDEQLAEAGMTIYLTNNEPWIEAFTKKHPDFVIDEDAESLDDIFAEENADDVDENELLSGLYDTIDVNSNDIQAE